MERKFSSSQRLALFVIFTVLLTINSSAAHSIQSCAEDNSTDNSTDYLSEHQKIPITWYSYDGENHPQMQTDYILPDDAIYLIELFNSLNGNIVQTAEILSNPYMQDIIDFTKTHNLNFPSKEIKTRFQQFQKTNPTIASIDSSKPFGKQRASEFFCNYVSSGWGIALPVIILPRVIPIILSPLPRVFLHWSARVGLTSCGGMLTNTGFQASGEQRGTAIGFWGIGFSIFLPPFKAYGLFGYALFTTVSAKIIKYFDINYPPDVTALSPEEGANNVPITQSQIHFNLHDFENQPMGYSVTTNPNIGSGNDGNVYNGDYHINISGLQPATAYSWTVQVTDGENTIEETYSFTTQS